MTRNQQIREIATALARYRAGQLSRREALRLLGALGVTAGAAMVYAGRGRVLAQDGTPPAMATPQLGERPDGTVVWRVQAGALDMADLAMVMAFFPEGITINAGDTIFFADLEMGHTVTFLSGQEMPALLVPLPDLATPVAEITGGQPVALENPEGIFPAGGDTYDGTGYVNSGIPFDPTAPPFTLTFTQPGTYDYVCLIHYHVMTGTVVVQEAGSDLPQTQADYDAMTAAQSAEMLSHAQALIDQYSAATPTAGEGGAAIHEVAVGVGEGKLELMRFVPGDLTIAAGDTVRWTNRAIVEPHTVTFLGGEEPPEDTLVVPQGDDLPLLLQNGLTWNRQGGDVFSGTGYTNSGVLVPSTSLQGDKRIAIEMAPTTTYELTFDTPGEYPYYCAFHAAGPDDPEGMTGKITVTAS